LGRAQDGNAEGGWGISYSVGRGAERKGEIYGFPRDEVGQHQAQEPVDEPYACTGIGIFTDCLETEFSSRDAVDFHPPSLFDFHVTISHHSAMHRLAMASRNPIVQGGICPEHSPRYSERSPFPLVFLGFILRATDRYAQVVEAQLSHSHSYFAICQTS
jgi:hypothetical protein